MTITFMTICICLGMLGCSPSVMTQSQALDMFNKVGGTEQANREARIIFDQFNGKESKEIFGNELTNFPTLSALGKPLFIQAGSNGYSSRIEIPIGSHYGRKFVFIFNPNEQIDFPYASRCIQVTSNIFVGK